jgi:transcriptional regulator GlxA family with amidase domain
MSVGFDDGRTSFDEPLPAAIAERRVRKVLEIIRERWQSPPRVSELARHVGLGASRLEHLFKQEARISIRDYIRARRLNAVAEMLVTTEERISTIGYCVGFTDVPNFNHAFKERFGVSPREFRERHHRDGSTSHQPRAEGTK